MASALVAILVHAHELTAGRLPDLSSINRAHA
jgi:hypothetical protein